ncbi:hypothetical protein JX266_008697 [Neoarthrinium moseri]|uniref:uncharacterized protein n=1 Tax=Neoarthrinium moseri TaxID=1658444 RepID=UPI001FDCF47D|nr:uncharacterized protein JN550_010140 [Neoarthrinium moseri]KAI1845150.1 hypothetical protein JX266_008697 [Neoarthrinium moseri]KAI1862615.1 hypothetical protein JN550_010140 [Neoarthrinium moseri]
MLACPRAKRTKDNFLFDANGAISTTHKVAIRHSAEQFHLPIRELDDQESLEVLRYVQPNGGVYSTFRFNFDNFTRGRRVVLVTGHRWAFKQATK